MAKLKLERILRDVDDLPALPDVAVRIIQATSDPNSDAQRLARIITVDQALTAKILRIANSASYGLSRRIGTVTEAIVLLGTNKVRDLAIAAATHDLLRKEFPGYALERGELWRHSVASALAAQTLATKVGLESPERVFVAALLHDVGKRVLDVYVGAKYPDLLEVVGEGKHPFPEAEREILGFDHAELGGMCAEKWQLPPDLADAIRFHHEPSRAEKMTDLLAAAHIADIICITLGIGLGRDGLMYRLDDAALRHLGVTHADVMVVMGETVQQISSTRLLFELDGVNTGADGGQEARVA